MLFPAYLYDKMHTYDSVTRNKIHFDKGYCNDARNTCYMIAGWLSFHTNGRLMSLYVLFVLSHSNDVIVHCSFFEMDAGIIRTFVVIEYQCAIFQLFFACTCIGSF